MFKKFARYFSYSSLEYLPPVLGTKTSLLLIYMLKCANISFGVLTEHRANRQSAEIIPLEPDADNAAVGKEVNINVKFSKPHKKACCNRHAARTGNRAQHG